MADDFSPHEEKIIGICNAQSDDKTHQQCRKVLLLYSRYWRRNGNARVEMTCLGNRTNTVLSDVWARGNNI